METKTVVPIVQEKKLTWLAYVVCILGALFYLYEFVLQVSPSVMTADLMRDLGLNAASLGVVSAFYYYAYTPMQLPAGILYDRYGPRALITVATLICAAGAFAFGLTNGVGWASVGRFLMGVGSAFSFIGALVLVSRWFPAKYFALLAGIVQLMSSIGAIAGQAPLAAIVAVWGWRHTILVVAGLGIILAAVVYAVVRDNPPGAKMVELPAHSGSEWKRLKKILSSRPHWLTAIYSFTTWAPIVAFAALWGVPYLVSAYHVSTAQASAACSMIWLGIGLGSPALGWFSDHLGLRRLPLIWSSVLALVSVLGILYVPGMSLPVMYVLLFIFGLAASSQALSFGLVKDITHPNMVGTAIGFNNMAVVAGGAIFQPLVGVLLYAHWNGVSIGGVPSYTADDYRLAMLVLPLCSLIGILISIFSLRETHCRSIYDS